MKRNDITVGFFLVTRYIRGANIWTTILITFIMLLTFLNLTVVGGILEGIVVGSFDGLRERALGDVYISPKEGQIFVNRSQQIISQLTGNPRVAALSPRLAARVEIIAEDEIFNVINVNEKRHTVSGTVLGINPAEEDATTGLSRRILEGEYFSGTGRREVLVGSALMERYSPFGADVLSGIHPGDSVYIRIGDVRSGEFGQVDSDVQQPGSLRPRRSGSGGVLQKYLVRGVYRTKAGELDLSVMMHADEVRGHVVNPANNVSGIAVRLANPRDAITVQRQLLDSGFSSYASIETIEEAVGPFLNDIRTVFQVLGLIIGSIGLAVSSITIFIIIFVTAVSRQKFIGILKAIGVTPSAVRFSYVLYALFFSVLGVILGLAVLYILLVPFFQANPIPFPFSDGILYVTPLRNVIYIMLLFLATAVAALIPAHRIIRRPAIDSVRGR